MMIAAPSVPHTGKHFLESRVFKGYQAIAPVHEGHMLGNVLITAHFDIGFMDAWVTWVRALPTVITLRHPARVLESYRRRATIGSKFASYLRQWESLMYIVKEAKDVSYLCIDDMEVREAQAEDIRNKFNLNVFNWSVTSETGSKHNTHDLVLTDELLKDVPVEFINFYQEKLTCLN